MLLEDITTSKFENDTFDIITSSMVLNYLDDKNLSLVFDKFRLWLRNDGRLFYVIPHPVRMVYGDLTKYFSRGRSEGETPWGTMTIFHRRTVSDYINATIQAGFTIELVDEPEVPERAEKDNPAQYKKYTSYPTRLVVKAKK